MAKSSSALPSSTEPSSTDCPREDASRITTRERLLGEIKEEEREIDLKLRELIIGGVLSEHPEKIEQIRALLTRQAFCAYSRKKLAWNF